MAIDLEQTRYVARLARIDLADEELERLTTDLQKIVGYVEQLAEVDTDGVEPIANIAGLEHVVRKDEPGPMLDRKDLLNGAPHANDSAFLVPKAVER
ncbi:MAG: Asp-tRNA(Asn)/Glu-tRNA(Gln) amidotransferase subunit GatC [Planctomycetota bacterium]